MRFWDTSALVPLFIAERESGAAVKRLREDPEIVVWTLARLELLANGLVLMRVGDEDRHWVAIVTRVWHAYLTPVAENREAREKT